eukprot:m.381774 g.381774  ORF g.381774 m.381774 type:complete len:102 (-) comp16717_c0_seq3:44-349(-)
MHHAQHMMDILVSKVGDWTTVPDHKGLAYSVCQVQVQVTFHSTDAQELEYFRFVVHGADRVVDRNVATMPMFVTDPDLFSANCASKTAMNVKARKDLEARS